MSEEVLMLYGLLHPACHSRGNAVLRSVSPREVARIAFALLVDTGYTSLLQTRGGAVWQLVGLITRRSQVQILPPQPKS
jgi:hypothetical protein